MIQRKQTLFLLIAAVLVALTISLPLGKYLAGDEEFVLTAFSVSLTGTGKIVGTLPLTVLGIMALALPLVTIFLYKRRLVQIRLCFSEFVLLTGFQGFIVWYLIHVKNTLAAGGDELAFVYSVTAIFPLVSIFFTWIALRGIMKDEALVRSMDRIR